LEKWARDLPMFGKSIREKQPAMASSRLTPSGTRDIIAFVPPELKEESA
jgi:hypothetical protein